MRTVPQRMLMARRMPGVMAWRKAVTQPVRERNQRPEAMRTPVRNVMASVAGRVMRKAPRSIVPSKMAWGFIQVTMQALETVWPRETGWSLRVSASGTWRIKP